MLKNTQVHWIIALLKIFVNLTYKAWAFVSKFLDNVRWSDRFWKRTERQSTGCPLNLSPSGIVDSVGGTMNQCFLTFEVTVQHQRPSLRRGAQLEVLTTLWLLTVWKHLLQEGSCLYNELSTVNQPTSTGRDPRESKPLVHLLLREPWSLTHFSQSWIWQEQDIAYIPFIHFLYCADTNKGGFINILI